MPYTQGPEIFRQAIAEVTAIPEVRQRIDLSEASDRALTQFLEQRLLEIWSGAGKAIVEYNDAEKAAATRQAEYTSLAERKPVFLRMVEDILPPVGSLLFLSLFSLFSGTVRHFVATQAAIPRVWLWLGITVAAVVVLLVVARIAGRIPAYRAAVAAADAVRKKASEDMKSYEQQIVLALHAAIAANINEFLDNHARPPFRLDLPDAITSTYTEVGHPDNEIITDAQRNVRRMLERMNGGSIGIAGPRGCGKTTLLRSFYREGAINAGTLSIFATAPVEYDSREFLLQLFTLICSRILSKETKTEEQPAWTQMDSLRDLPSRTSIDSGILTSIGLVAGVFLLFSGMMILIADTAGPPAKSTSASQNQSSGSAPQARQSAPAQPSPAPADSTPSPVPFFIWGSVSTVIGLILRFAPGQPAPTDPIDFFFGPWTRARALVREDRKNQAMANEGVDPNAFELLDRTRRTLKGLRFQQSYSSGWSGTLKLPVGIEGGVNAAVSYAERQLGLPEIVHEYREFLREAAKRYGRILIAIDELDKLESDEAAKKFLNSIKAIFGQRQVYYLISISENALSNFERRGLPIRDEFDSSFDDAIHIGYLDAGASRRLLARRATEPPPDVYRTYCYVASGGLPRDLIRCCRKLYDFRRANPAVPNTVAATCGEVTRRDICAKVEAIRYSLVRIPDEKRTAAVLNLLSAAIWDAEALKLAITRLDESQTAFEAAAVKIEQDGKQSADDLRALAGTAEEIKVYLFFCYAVIGVFDEITSEADYQKHETGKTFDRLAIARQWMAVNRAAAIDTIALIKPLPTPPDQPPPDQAQAVGAGG